MKNIVITLFTILSLISMDAIAQNTIYNYKVKALDGSTLDLSKYKGKKILIVNVASQCGYTPQYADLEKLYKMYGDKLVIIGFPCNQFGGQEPGTAAEIHQFCTASYGVTFPMADKVDVKGDNQAPIYKFLTQKTQNGYGDNTPSWNFCKYLIDEKGHLVGYFPSKVTPMSDELIAAIKK